MARYAFETLRVLVKKMAIRLQPIFFRTLRSVSRQYAVASLVPLANSKSSSAFSGKLALLASGAALTTAVVAQSQLQTSSCDSSSLSNLRPVENVKDLDVVLYQYQPCPFCNKVRAFLDFHKVPLSDFVLFAEPRIPKYPRYLTVLSR